MMARGRSRIGEPLDYSVARRLNGERIVLLGWARAILMQLAHPLVAAGVAEHTSFRGGLVSGGVRLHHTVRAMLSLTFGDERARSAAIAGIRTIHTRVHGTLRDAAGPFERGTRYSAEDPALLLWVHATLLDSVPDVYQRLVGPVPEHDLDAWCAESASLLEALGGDPAGIPRTWRELRAYMAMMQDSGRLIVTPAARRVADGVLSPKVAPGLPFPTAPLHRLLTAGLLPPPLRQAYGFPWSERHARRFAYVMHALHVCRRVTPDLLARWPQARGLSEPRDGAAAPQT